MRSSTPSTATDTTRAARSSVKRPRHGGKLASAATGRSRSREPPELRLPGCLGVDCLARGVPALPVALDLSL